MSAVTSVESGYAWIESFHGIDRGDFKANRSRLARMRSLLHDFDDPHIACRVIHVAGSKGKGSTAALIGAVLDAAGYRCGVYSSPHVETHRERVRVLDGSLTDDLAVELFRRIERHIDTIRPLTPRHMLPTFFELVTLFGFLAFRETGCDVAVVEVGIGGRTDATNLVRPVASVITPVELEHTDRLGFTLRAVAGEKAGTIKRGVPVFVGSQHREALETIRRVAELRSAPVHVLEEHTVSLDTDLSLDGTTMALLLANGRSVRTTLRLIGRVHAENAALAAFVVSGVFRDVPADRIAAGLAAAWIPGRSELVPGQPAVLLDGAHTERSIGLLCDTAAELCPDRARRVAVFGSVVGKNHAAMLARLVPAFSRIVITRPGTFKPSDLDVLCDTCRSLAGVCEVCEDTDAAIAAARRPAEGVAPGLIVVTGSFYLVGAARARLRAEQGTGTAR